MERFRESHEFVMESLWRDLYRAGLDACSAALPGHAGDHLDPGSAPPQEHARDGGQELPHGSVAPSRRRHVAFTMVKTVDFRRCRPAAALVLVDFAGLLPNGVLDGARSGRCGRCRPQTSIAGCGRFHGLTRSGGAGREVA